MMAGFRGSFPYVICCVLIICWMLVNGSMLMGVIPFTTTVVKPIVTQELVGRILGHMDAAMLISLNWVYQQQQRSRQRAEDASPSVGRVGAALLLIWLIGAYPYA